MYNTRRTPKWLQVQQPMVCRVAPQQLPIGSPVGGLLHLIAVHADRLLEITPVNPIGHSAEIFDSRVTRLNSRVGTVHTPNTVRLPITNPGEE